MTKKSLDESAITNELKESSVFFREVRPSPTIPNRPVKESGDSATVAKESAEPMRSDTGATDHPIRETETAIEQKNGKEIKPLSMPASKQARYPASMIEEIRKSVKSVGKEISFIRMTPQEKNQLMDVVYTYKRTGAKTSENEINRIAINFLLADYKANGEASILARVIEALLA